MNDEAIKITANEAPTKLRVTLAEIAEVKRQHILDNLCYSFEEVGAIFSKSTRWVIERVKDGKFVVVDDCARSGKGGFQLSNGARITALSIGTFRQEYEIAPEKWGE